MALDGTDVFDDLTEMPAGMAGMRPKGFGKFTEHHFGVRHRALIFSFPNSATESFFVTDVGSDRSGIRRPRFFDVLVWETKISQFFSDFVNIPR